MRGPRWQRAIAELRGWFDTQTIHSPAEVRRTKVRFNERVAAMSSYEIEYLLDSISQKMDLLNTPQAQDAKAWLGEYLAAMSDARRARELRAVPNLLEMNAAELLQEIQRIDRKRGALRQRQQGVDSRQNALVDRAAANRQASADAARATAERLRATPAQAPAGQGGGKPPFSDVPRRQTSIGVGPMGAFITM
jgi:predicted  nucleic acid-binding Zn-ribbon protein